MTVTGALETRPYRCGRSATTCKIQISGLTGLGVMRLQHRESFNPKTEVSAPGPRRLQSGFNKLLFMVFSPIIARGQVSVVFKRMS